MGRPRRYRERIQFEMQSVQAKSIQNLLSRTLQKDFGRSRLESEVLARRSLDWLHALGVVAVPGQVCLSVPATPSRRYARQRRLMVTVTAVDVGEDTEVWRTYGLAALKRRRLLRYLYEIYRSGGWASLTPRPVLPAAHYPGQRPDAPGGHACEVRTPALATEPLPAGWTRSGNTLGQQREKHSKPQAPGFL